MTHATVAGTMAGGAIRTLTLPFGDAPDLAAVRAVLMSWLRANHIDPARLRDRDRIEIHPDAHFGHVIMFREVLTPAPGAGGHEARTTVRKMMLRVEPEGLLADELTCGHVHTSPSPVADADPLNFTCDQDINPADGRHPGDHTGNRSIDPETNRPAGPDGTGYRMTWPNTHPGEQAYHAGLPTTDGLTTTAAHALILARLAAIADRRPPVNRRKSLIAIFKHVRGLREIAVRHLPRDTRHAGTVCDHDFVSATGLTPWPCVEVRDALAGIVHFPPQAAQ